MPINQMENQKIKTTLPSLEGWHFDGQSVLDKNGIDVCRKTNGNLIAATPDLLNACSSAIKWAIEPRDHGGNPWLMEFVKLAHCAIAKARGEVPDQDGRE